MAAHPGRSGPVRGTGGRGPRKADLLAGAACLWMPALWDEPFGLTLIEALASGTPGAGHPAGGAAGDRLAGRRRARRYAGRAGGAAEPGSTRIDPAACRARVERHFTHHVMAAGYVRMFREFLATGMPAGRGEPLGTRVRGLPARQDRRRPHDAAEQRPRGGACRCARSARAGARRPPPARPRPGRAGPRRSACGDRRGCGRPGSRTLAEVRGGCRDALRPPAARRSRRARTGAGSRPAPRRPCHSSVQATLTATDAPA